MAVLGGVVGAIAAFTIGILFTQVWFTSRPEWLTVIPLRSPLEAGS